MQTNRGGVIIRVAILIIVIILILSYFKIDIRDLKNDAENIWTEHLREPAKYVWNDIFIGLFWNSFVDNVVKTDKESDFEKSLPSVKPR